jgi:hypothetical protein
MKTNQVLMYVGLAAAAYYFYTKSTSPTGALTPAQIQANIAAGVNTANQDAASVGVQF